MNETRDDTVLRRTAPPGMVVTERSFELPLAPDAPGDDRTLAVFAREVVAKERRDDELPYLVFFQGGPGSPAPRPESRGGWLERALEDHRVLLLDQRGTGLSTPVTHQTLAALDGPEAQAEYLTHFRADAIVADAEAIRARLIGDAPWTVLGQSFGGFCVLRYLSAAPEGVRAALVTGGIPPLERPAEDVYRATYGHVSAKNRAFFARYPHAQQLCRRIAERLHAEEVRLPNGQRFTPEQFQQLGLALGGGTGMERLMALLEHAFVPVGGGREALSYAFLHGAFTAMPFHTNPIFTLLHEAIYAQGEATRWAAQRVRAERPRFDWAPGREFLFTGEMVYPWMLAQFPTLAPLREAGELLAAKDDWPALYDAERLEANRVPLAAILYAEDMYVDLGYARETLARMPHTEAWVTNAYEHDGLRADGERILDRLFAALPVVDP